MSYSVGFIPAVVEGATFCPGGYVLRVQGRAPTCYPRCPPGWTITREGGDNVCAEPGGGPLLKDGCPGEFGVVDYEQGYEYCSPTCPSGWGRSVRGGVRYCEGPPSAAPAPRPAPKALPGAGPGPPRQRAGVAPGALPWWAYAAGGAVVLGSAAYYAWG